jgi:hypothetical protein
MCIRDRFEIAADLLSPLEYTYVMDKIEAAKEGDKP